MRASGCSIHGTLEQAKEKIVKEVVDVVDPNLYSEFARHYDDGCTGWCKDPEANLTFLKLQQSFANDKLKERGYLFLNEVYAFLKSPSSIAFIAAASFFSGVASAMVGGLR